MKLKFKVFASFFFLSMLLVSCVGKKDDSIPEFRFFNLSQELGWKSKTIYHQKNEINYKATQVPIHYYIIKNAETNDAKLIDSIYNAHSTERIIEFEYEHNSKDDLLKSEYTNVDYTTAVKYMSFQLQNDFKVITDSGKTIACAGVTFERNFKLAPFKRVLLHFGGIPENENIKLIYNDKLFDNGQFEYNFKETPLKL